MKTIHSFGAAPRTTTKPSPHLQWRWHRRALVKLRERLLDHRSQLVADVGEPIEHFSLHMADAATDQFEHDLALSRLSAEQDVLYEVDAALARIRGGTYGICEATGKPIASARLRAIPWTRFTEQVEEELERRGACRCARLGELNSVHDAWNLAAATSNDMKDEEDQ